MLRKRSHFWDFLRGRSGRVDPANVEHGCKVFMREGIPGQNNLFVEVHKDGDIKVYSAPEGITPPYISEPYDSWCLEYLEESYVFPSFDRAIAYFARARADIVPALEKRRAALG
jgi:hypothetical protein